MNAARQTDGLLTAGQTIALLDLLGQSQDGVAGDRAARDLAASKAASHARTYNTIAILADAGFLVRNGERFACRRRNGEDWRLRIAAWVAQQIADRMVQHGAHALHLHDDRLVVDTMLLPGPADGLRLWMIEFGIATRGEFGSRRWLVAEQFADVLMGAAKGWNERRRRVVSQAALDVILDRQAESGAVAEEWVLARERLRLSTHPLVGQIERVSVDDVGAGYDIVSFSGATTLVHDLFIEVKSFSGFRRFFWTKNEIETARRLGETYCLCIVDRTRMSDPSYVPEVISAPYAALVETPDNGWSVSPATFECIAIKP